MPKKKYKRTKDQRDDMVSIRAALDKDEKYRQRLAAHAKRLVTQFKKNDYQSPDAHAEFLARICSDLDESYGLGTTLCIDWMLEHYMAIQFQRAYPWMIGIWRYLIDKGHDERHKLSYGNDHEAFFISKDRMIFVCGTGYHGEPRYLVMDSLRDIAPGMMWHDCLVRLIWRKTRLNCIKSVDQPTLKHYRSIGFEPGYHDKGNFRSYGDARDKGHVLSYTNLLGQPKCDNVIWNVRAPISFFFEVNTLWSDTAGEAAPEKPEE